MFPEASTLVGQAFHTKSTMILFRVKALRVGSTFKTLSTEVLMPEEIFRSCLSRQPTNFLSVLLKNR